MEDKRDRRPRRTLNPLNERNVRRMKPRNSRQVPSHGHRQFLPHQRFVNNESINLESTVREFGYKSGFSVSKYVNDYYKTVPSSDTSVHKERLLKRRDLTSEKLQEHVTGNYPTFIETSKEITSIESNMAKLTDFLNEYKQCIKDLHSVSFQFEEDDNINNKSRKPNKVGQSTKLSLTSLGTLNNQLELQELAEDLRSDIYERNFEAAVVGIETAHEQSLLSKRTKEEDDEEDDLLSDDEESGRDQRDRKQRKLYDPSDPVNIIREYEKELINVLLRDLRNHNLKKYERRQVVGFLLRLNQKEVTLDIFLSQKTKNIHSLLRTVKVQGDSSLYCKEVCTITCKQLMDTVEEYQKIFASSNAKMSMSHVVSWIVKELKELYIILQKQVFQSHSPASGARPTSYFTRLGLALEYLFSICAKIMRKGGLNVLFLLGNYVRIDLSRIIRENFKDMEARIVDEIEKDEWESIDCWVVDQREKLNSSTKLLMNQKKRRALRLTSSAKFLFVIVRELLKHISPILQVETYYQNIVTDLYPVIVEGIIHIFEGYLLSIANVSKKSDITTKQSLSVIANAFYLADDLIPRVKDELHKRLHHNIPQLESFKEKVTKLYEALLDSYIHRCTQYWIFDILEWNKLTTERYCIDPNGDYDMKVSSLYIKLNNIIVDLVTSVAETLDLSALDTVISSISEQLFKSFANPKLWHNINITGSGIELFLLDCLFLQETFSKVYYTHTSKNYFQSTLKLLTQQSLRNDNTQIIELAKKTDRYRVVAVSTVVEQKNCVYKRIEEIKMKEEESNNIEETEENNEKKEELLVDIPYASQPRQSLFDPTRESVLVAHKTSVISEQEQKIISSLEIIPVTILGDISPMDLSSSIPFHHSLALTLYESGIVEQLPGKVMHVSSKRNDAIDLSVFLSAALKKKMNDAKMPVQDDIIGHNVEFDSKFSVEKTQYLSTSMGILLQELHTDPLLSACSILILPTISITSNSAMFQSLVNIVNKRHDFRILFICDASKTKKDSKDLIHLFGSQHICYIRMHEGILNDIEEEDGSDLSNSDLSNSDYSDSDKDQEDNENYEQEEDIEELSKNPFGDRNNESDDNNNNPFGDNNDVNEDDNDVNEDDNDVNEDDNDVNEDNTKTNPFGDETTTSSNPFANNNQNNNDDDNIVVKKQVISNPFGNDTTEYSSSNPFSNNHENNKSEKSIISKSEKSNPFGSDSEDIIIEDDDNNNNNNNNHSNNPFGEKEENKQKTTNPFDSSSPSSSNNNSTSRTSSSNPFGGPVVSSSQSNPFGSASFSSSETTDNKNPFGKSSNPF